MIGADWPFIVILSGYSVLVSMVFVVSCIKLGRWIKNKKKPKLKLIQGGKKDQGPYNQ